MFPHFSGFLHSFHYISLLEFSWELFFVFVYIVDYQCVLYLVRLPPPPQLLNASALFTSGCVLLLYYSLYCSVSCMKNGCRLNISAFSCADTFMYFKNVLSFVCPVIFIMAIVGTPAL